MLVHSQAWKIRRLPISGPQPHQHPSPASQLPFPAIGTSICTPRAPEVSPSSLSESVRIRADILHAPRTAHRSARGGRRDSRPSAPVARRSLVRARGARARPPRVRLALACGRRRAGGSQTHRTGSCRVLGPARVVTVARTHRHSFPAPAAARRINNRQQSSRALPAPPAPPSCVYPPRAHPDRARTSSYLR